MSCANGLQMLVSRQSRMGEGMCLSAKDGKGSQAGAPFGVVSNKLIIWTLPVGIGCFIG